MNGTIEKTGLWAGTLGLALPDADHVDQIARLRVELAKFRNGVAAIASRIAATFPDLTTHDVTHLDALWETADIIAGKGYPLNPLEAFVFGGAILIHDAAHCFEAFEGGQKAVRETLQWRDAYRSEIEKHPEENVCTLEQRADFVAVRLLHAKQGALLAERGWKNPDTGQELFLLDDFELRSRFGAAIGEIAASHHWPIEDLTIRFRPQINAPSAFPNNWRVDPVKLACLLRCADAAHIDERRAPDFLYAILRRNSVSWDHWRAQNRLARLDYDTSDATGQSGLITSSRAFEASESTSWWVAYEAVTVLDKEIRSSNELLLSRPQSNYSPPFRLTRITGAGFPSELSRYIETKNWEPTDAKIHISNVERLVGMLGGQKLYGTGQDELATVLRELIQNARDAIVARRYMDQSHAGRILVRLREHNNTVWLEVSDDGLGMSKRTLTGPLLDFGSSFWVSDLMKEEFPGLKASGFHSVGQFGIGFYSVFMISSNIEVASRRFDAGLADVWRLQFKQGLSVRPIIARAAPSDFGSSSSTRIKVRLEGDLSGYMIREVKSGRIGQEDLRIPFRKWLAAIASGLDVQVDLRIGDTPAITAHRPIQDVVTDEQKLEWLRDISFSEEQGVESVETYIARNATRMRPLLNDSRTVALAALNDAANNTLNFVTTDTVGGLTASPQRGAGAFIGFMDYEPRSAKRDIAERAVPKEILEQWAVEQIGILHRRETSDLEWYWAASSLSKLELDPLQILRIPLLVGTQVRLFRPQDVYKLILKSNIAAIKMRQVNVIDVQSQIIQLPGMLTLRPLAPSSLNSIELVDGTPKSPFSFIGCLYRQFAVYGKRLRFKTVKDVARGPFGPMDALVLSV